MTASPDTYRSSFGTCLAGPRPSRRRRPAHPRGAQPLARVAPRVTTAGRPRNHA